MSPRAPLTLIEVTQSQDLNEIPSDAVDAISELSFEIDVARAVSVLSPREALVVGLSLGTDPRGSHSLVEIAELCGLSISQASRSYAAGIRGLRMALAPSYRSGFAVAA